MSYFINISITNTKLNNNLVDELHLFSSSMTKVNITSDITMLYFMIPTILVIVVIKTYAVKLFRSLETNFVYKMIIYDSINNIMFAIVGTYGHTYRQPLPFAPFCSLIVALQYGLGNFNRLVPLVIVLYRYVKTKTKSKLNLSYVLGFHIIRGFYFHRICH